MEIVFCLLSFAAGGVSVFICMLWLLRAPAASEGKPQMLHERQYLNFLNYDGTERGQMKIDE